MNGAEEKKKFRIKFPKFFSKKQSLSYDKFNYDDILNAINRTYTWILFNLQKELSPLIVSLEWMMDPDYLKSVDPKFADLGTLLIDAVVENILGPDCTLKISDTEKVLLTGFLLAPVFAFSDVDSWDDIFSYIAMQSNRDEINWKPLFKFITYCLVYPDREHLIEELKTKKIDYTDFSDIIDDFFKGVPGNSVVYNSLLEMFKMLHKGKKKLDYTPKDPNKEIAFLSGRVLNFLKAVTALKE